MLPYGMVILFCMYFFCNVYEKSLSVFKDAAGIWREDRFRPLIYGICNFVINIMLVKVCGLYGIILSTVLTCMAISIPWIVNNVFNLIYHRKKSQYVQNIIFYSIVICVVSVINYFICSMINIGPIGDLVVRGIISLIIPNLIFIMVYHKKQLFKESISLIQRMLH